MTKKRIFKFGREYHPQARQASSKSIAQLYPHDLDCLNFLQADSKTDWSGCNLSNRDLSHFKGTGFKLNGCDLSHSKLNGAKLQGAQLCGANLAEAKLCGAKLPDANLNGADLRRADLQGADLRRCDFRNACLSDANFKGADVQDAQFKGSIGLSEDTKRTLTDQGAIFKDSTNPPDVKWWTEHVFVRIVVALIGSGGLIAVITTLKNEKPLPTTPEPTTQSVSQRFTGMSTAQLTTHNSNE